MIGPMYPPLWSASAPKNVLSCRPLVTTGLGRQEVYLKRQERFGSGVAVALPRPVLYNPLFERVASLVDLLDPVEAFPLLASPVKGGMRGMAVWLTAQDV